MIVTEPDNPFEYEKIPTNQSNKSGQMRGFESSHIKQLKDSLRLDLKTNASIKKRSKVQLPDASRKLTVQAFGDDESKHNPELTKKAKMSNNKINFTDTLQTIEFYKNLKEESLKVLNKGNKGTMYVKDLWGRNYYSRVVKKSGIEKIIDNMRRLHWQNKDDVLEVLEKNFRAKHKDDVGINYMDYLVAKYKEKYGSMHGTPANRSRRDSTTQMSQFATSTATKTPGPSKLKLPNIHDKSNTSDYFTSPSSHRSNHTDMHLHDHPIKSSKFQQYDKIRHIAQGSDLSGINYLQNVNWMEDSASDGNLSFKLNDTELFNAELEDIHQQCNTARASTHDIKKKIEFLEKFMHLSLAKDRRVKLTFAHKMKNDTIKDFQSLLKHNEKFEDFRLKEIKSNFEKRRDEIVKQASENAHKHQRPSLMLAHSGRPQFKISGK